MATQVTNNDIQSTVPKKWSRYFQMHLDEHLTGKDIANTKFEADLTFGDSVQVNKLNTPSVRTYNTGYEYEPEDVNSFGETLTIDQNEFISVSLEDKQKKQSANALKGELMMRSAYAMKNAIDRNILSYVDQGRHTFNDAGSPFDLSSDSIQDILMEAQATIERTGTMGMDNFAIVADPYTIKAMGQDIIANGFKEADKNLVSSFKGRYLDIAVYKSTNLPAKQVLTLDAQPVDGDVFKIAGATFTFVDSLASNEGEVLIGVDAAGTASNLAEAINGDDTSNYVEIADRRRKGLSADAISAVVNGAELTLTGAGHLGVSLTVDAASYTLGTEVIKHYFGRPGGISYATQINPRIEKVRSEKRFADVYKMKQLYGIKVFEEGADMFGALEIAG